MKRYHVAFLVVLPILSLLGYVTLSKVLTFQVVRVLVLTPLWIGAICVVYSNSYLKPAAYVLNILVISIIAGGLVVLVPIMIGILPKITESLAMTVNAFAFSGGAYFLFLSIAYLGFRLYNRVKNDV